MVYIIFMFVFAGEIVMIKESQSYNDPKIN
jgi:hypothetical protein